MGGGRQPGSQGQGGAAGRAPEQGWNDPVGADSVPVARATERSCGGRFCDRAVGGEEMVGGR